MLGFVVLLLRGSVVLLATVDPAEGRTAESVVGRTVEVVCWVVVLGRGTTVVSRLRLITGESVVGLAVVSRVAAAVVTDAVVSFRALAVCVDTIGCKLVVGFSEASVCAVVTAAVVTLCGVTVVGCGAAASGWTVVMFAVVAAVSSIVVGETNESNTDKENRSQSLLHGLQ